MQNVQEVNACIQDILIPYASNFAWQDFSDKGNICYNSFVFDSKEEEIDLAMTRAAVQLAMPYGSQAHHILGQKVASLLDTKWVTYDWLAKAISRLLSGGTYQELREMAALSELVRSRMKEKGLTQIKSIEEVLV